VAPLNCDSGKRRGQRTTWGGRASVRRALYMATLVATRYNDRIRTFYHRLLDRGKEESAGGVDAKTAGHLEYDGQKWDGLEPGSSHAFLLTVKTVALV